MHMSYININIYTNTRTHIITRRSTDTDSCMTVSLPIEQLLNNLLILYISGENQITTRACGRCCWS